MTPDLYYYIAEARLIGTVDGQTFWDQAGSGGRAGSKVKGAVNPLLANNPFMTCSTGSGKSLDGYGPLPPGIYYMKTHETKSNWIRLNPDPKNDMCGRAGFAIHGRGQTGSHGCIVPNDFGIVQRIYALCAARQKKQESAPVLQVTGTTMMMEGASPESFYWT